MFLSLKLLVSTTKVPLLAVLVVNLAVLPQCVLTAVARMVALLAVQALAEAVGGVLRLLRKD